MPKRGGLSRMFATTPFRESKPQSAESKRAARQRHRAPVGSGGFSGAQLKAQGDAQAWRCYWCGLPCADNYHIDHVKPLSKGGSNRIDNVVIACPSCNLRKGSNDWSKKSD